MNNPLAFIIKHTLLIFIQLLKVTTNTLFFLMPVGVYILILQFAKKMNAISALEAFVDREKGEWMYIYPNTILVSADANLYKTQLNKLNRNVNKFIEKNRYTLFAIFCILLICLMVSMVILGV